MALVSKKGSYGLSFSYSLGCDGLFKIVNSPTALKPLNITIAVWSKIYTDIFHLTTSL